MWNLCWYYMPVLLIFRISVYLIFGPFSSGWGLMGQCCAGLELRLLALKACALALWSMSLIQDHHIYMLPHTRYRKEQKANVIITEYVKTLWNSCWEWLFDPEIFKEFVSFISVSGSQFLMNFPYPSPSFYVFMKFVCENDLCTSLHGYATFFLTE